MSTQALLQAPRNVRSFEAPTLVRYAEAVRFLWGDAESHYVPDLLYGNGARLSAVIYRLAPGEYFRASKAWRPIYDEHRYYYVVSGALTIQDPESGDVAVARAGEAVYWRGARYHFGYNFSEEEVLVLDWFAPPEQAGGTETEIELSARKRVLGAVAEGRRDLLGQWPEAALRDMETRLREGRMVTLRPETSLHFVQGERTPFLVTILASSETLTGGTFDLRAGAMTDPEVHAGDEVLYALKGSLHVYLPDSFEWFELHPLDCLFLPEGTRHQYRNNGSVMATGAFCVAPHYR